MAQALIEQTQVVPLEEMHITQTSYQRATRLVLIRRAESLLVREYVDSLVGHQTRRLRTPVGITDIHVSGPDGTEIIEAKSSSSHKSVRDALGQLLDYVPHSPTPVNSLAGLFPDQPSDDSVALLHRYGVDCLYRTVPGTFYRLPAPTATREHMAKTWTTS